MQTRGGGKGLHLRGILTFKSSGTSWCNLFEALQTQESSSSMGLSFDGSCCKYKIFASSITYEKQEKGVTNEGSTPSPSHHICRLTLTASRHVIVDRSSFSSADLEAFLPLPIAVAKYRYDMPDGSTYE